MTELTPPAKRLLAQLRDVDDPTAQERARGDAAVRDMLEAQGIVGLPPLAAGRAGKLARANSAGTQRAANPSASRGPRGGGAKIGWSLVAVLAAAFGLYAVLTLRAPASSPATPAQRAELAQPASPTPPAMLEQAVGASPSAPPGAAAREDAPGAAAAGSSAHGRRGAPKPAQTSLSEELKFLASVDAELRGGGYDHALQRLAQHKGSPALAEERAALRVLALCGRDNDAAAARARAHFLQGAPSSVLAIRVRGACTTGPQP